MTSLTRAQLGFAFVVLLFLFISLKPSSSPVSYTSSSTTTIPLHTNNNSPVNTSSSSSSSWSAKEKSKWTLSHLRPSFLSQTSPNSRLRLSESLWSASVRDRHTLLQTYPDQANMNPFPCTDGASYVATPFSIWDFFPASFNCPYEMERVGRIGDGGKWTCGLSRFEALPKTKPCVVYSFGIQYESSWEEAILSRTKCEVWGYDFSVSKFGDQIRPENLARAHFTQAGISGKTDTSRSPPFYSIKDLMVMNGHEHVDILKVDIEGAEYEALSALSEAFATPDGKGVVPVGQIMIELHLDPGGINMVEFLRWWENLEGVGWRPVWTEPNLLYVTLRMGDAMPRYAEYTLINVRDSENILLQ